ncbi:MAG: tellurite methyltransferase [Urechidicola sp.]|jgi:tellurite methyltransferase
MSEEDRNKWDQRYAEDSYRKRAQPGEFITQWIDRVTVGNALDVACGLGQKSMFLAESGFQVDAIDVSAIGLERAHQQAVAQGLDINWIQHDLDEPYDFRQKYDLIIVMWYVDLTLIRRLCGQLAPGGYLLCEEHLACDNDSGEFIGPRNASFRVAPNALRVAVAGFEVCYYDEYVGVSEGHPILGQASEASMISRARLAVSNKQ